VRSRADARNLDRAVAGDGPLALLFSGAACDAAAECLVAADCAEGACLEGRCVAPAPSGDDDDDGGVALPRDRGDAGPGEEPSGDPGLVGEQAYVIVRSDAFKCVDVASSSFENFNGVAGDVRQFTCNDGSAQVFWAIDTGVGTFALQNAHSGRCVEVDASSVAEGANVVQRACTLGDNRRWTPTERAPGLFTLTNRNSGKVLDVLGQNSLANGSNGTDGDLVQATFDGSADQLWRFTPAGRAAYVALESVSLPGRFMRVAGPPARDVTIDVALSGDAELRIRPGLADPEGITFEPRALPGFFLRHKFGVLSAEPDDATALFAADATFFIRPNLAGDIDFQCRSFESKNFPGSFLRHLGATVRIDVNDGSLALARDASWRIVTR